MPKRFFTEEVLKEWVLLGYKYILFTDKPDEYHILVKPINEPEDLIGLLLYESYLLAVDSCDLVTIQNLPFIDHSVALVCDTD
jgi:hypothetical protein